MANFQTGQVGLYFLFGFILLTGEGTAIAKIRQSKYFKSSNSEMMARIFIDILFCDRLNLLRDSTEAHLNWLPEVSLSAKIPNTSTVIAGRADWVLAYNVDSPSDSALVVL